MSTTDPPITPDPDHLRKARNKRKALRRQPLPKVQPVNKRRVNEAANIARRAIRNRIITARGGGQDGPNQQTKGHAK